MKKELNRFERIADGAYFAVDTRVFEATITSYDPLLANQAIVTQQVTDQIENEWQSDEDPNGLPLNS